MTTDPLSPEQPSTALAAFALLLAPAAAGQPPARVVAVGDVHGAYDEFTALLQRVGLIDASRSGRAARRPSCRQAMSWTAGRGRASASIS